MFEISRSFKDKLITGVLSSPIIYISHYHYNYVDQTLKELFPKSNSKDSIFGLDRVSIMEYSIEGLTIDFETKMPAKSSSSADFNRLNSCLPDFGFQVKDSYLQEDRFCQFLDSLIAFKSLRTDESFFEEGQTLFLIKNCAPYLHSSTIQEKLQIIALKYEQGHYPKEFTLLLVSPQPVEALPEELTKIISVVEIPNPTEREIRHYVEEQLSISEEFVNRESELKISLIRTLQGLQHYEIEQIIRSIQVRTGGRLTERSIFYALEEKKSIVKKTGIIEVVDSNVSFDQVGGLEILREDLQKKTELFKHLNELTNLKLPLPKGVLIIGMPGCGKSLIAKSIANEFGISLLRLDINRLMGQYVGQSEANLRKALATAEAAHPCVLWIDEIEKAFAGANGGGSSTNDIVMRLMGHFLTWMQERKTAIYIVATANDVMRPEFMRKGRFDEVYFVDFPSENERLDILNKKLEIFQQTTEQQSIFDFSGIDDSVKRELAKLMSGGEKNMSGFSGSEIESVVNSVMEAKFIEYYGQKEEHSRKPVKILKEDFSRIIKILQPSVMCNQVGSIKEKGSGMAKEKTAVERIRDLQSVYNFRRASK